MEIGIHVSLWTPHWDDPFIKYLEKASRLGFDAVEIPIMDPGKFPTDEVLRVLKDTGLKVYCGTGLSPATDISSTDPVVRAAGREHLFRCLAIAAELGSPSLQGVVHSAWGLQEPITAERRQASASVLAEAAGRAGQQGMRIALECINRYESSFLNTVKQGIHMLEMIGAPNVGLHLDTYHMNIEENSAAEAFAAAGSRLFHLHLSENQRGFPGSGLLNWPEIIGAARAAGYAGPWVIESYVFPEFATGPDVSVWRSIAGEDGDAVDRALGLSLEMLRRVI